MKRIVVFFSFLTLSFAPATNGTATFRDTKHKFFFVLSQKVEDSYIITATKVNSYSNTTDGFTLNIHYKSDRAYCEVIELVNGYKTQYSNFYRISETDSVFSYIDSPDIEFYKNGTLSVKGGFDCFLSSAGIGDSTKYRIDFDLRTIKAKGF